MRSLRFYNQKYINHPERKILHILQKSEINQKNYYLF